jgi:hypothetical protein
MSVRPASFELTNPRSCSELRAWFQLAASGLNVVVSIVMGSFTNCWFCLVVILFKHKHLKKAIPFCHFLPVFLRLQIRLWYK